MKEHTLQSQPRPTMEALKKMLTDLGWSYSRASWESEDRVYAFATESYPGTMGGSAAAVSWFADWKANDGTGWLNIPAPKNPNFKYV